MPSSRVPLFLLLVGWFASSQLVHAVPQTSFPETPFGAAASRLAQALNGAESDAEDFIENNLSKSAIDEIPAEQRQKWLRQVQKESGGVEVMEVRKISSDLLEIYVRTKLGGHWVRFYAFADRENPERIREYGAVPIRDPQFDKTEAWPEKHIDPATIAHEIDWRATNAAERDEFSGVILVAKDKEVLFQ